MRSCREAALEENLDFWIIIKAVIRPRKPALVFSDPEPMFVAIEASPKQANTRAHQHVRAN